MRSSPRATPGRSTEAGGALGAGGHPSGGPAIRGHSKLPALSKKSPPDALRVRGGSRSEVGPDVLDREGRGKPALEDPADAGVHRCPSADFGRSRLSREHGASVEDPSSVREAVAKGRQEPSARKAKKAGPPEPPWGAPTGASPHGRTTGSNTVAEATSLPASSRRRLGARSTRWNRCLRPSSPNSPERRDVRERMLCGSPRGTRVVVSPSLAMPRPSHTGRPSEATKSSIPSSR